MMGRVFGCGLDTVIMVGATTSCIAGLTMGKRVHLLVGQPVKFAHVTAPFSEPCNTRRCEHQRILTLDHLNQKVLPQMHQALAATCCLVNCHALLLLSFVDKLFNNIRHVERRSALYGWIIAQRLQMLAHQYTHRLDQPGYFLHQMPVGVCGIVAFIRV